MLKLNWNKKKSSTEDDKYFHSLARDLEKKDMPKTVKIKYQTKDFKLKLPSKIKIGIFF